MEYASRAVGNAGLATGIIGTALGALNGAGGLELLGMGARRPRDEGDIPVTRHDMGLYRELSEKDFKIASLEANKYTDQKVAELTEKMNDKIAGVTNQMNMQFGMERYSAGSDRMHSGSGCTASEHDSARDSQ